MRVLLSWEQFIRMQGIDEEFLKTYEDAVVSGEPFKLDALYYKVAGKDDSESWDGPADEYGERCWRICGKKHSLIVFDEGNGWSHPIGVEIDVEKFRFLTKDDFKGESYETTK